MAKGKRKGDLHQDSSAIPLAYSHAHPLAHPQESVGEAPSRNRLWLALIGLGIVLRLALAGISIGTNDAAAWLRFGDEIRQGGLLKTYTIDPDFNHPPVPGYWAAACARLAGDSDSALHDSIFTNLFKLAPILGDCLGMYLLFLIWRRRRGASFGLFVAAMYSLSLDAIVVSGFHCNTDSLLIALCLLALYLLEDRGWLFLAGVALAGAINVKIIPVLLIVPLLLHMRSWKDAGKFVGGLAIGVVPFVPALLEVRAQFIANALKYNSVLDRWGINYFLLFGEDAWVPGGAGEKISAAYYSKARYVILGLIGVWAVWARLKNRWTPTELAYLTFAIFLVLAPGFGVQYTVLPGLLLFALRPRCGIVYGVVAGLFVTTAYFVNWKGTFPLYSHWSTLFPEPVALLGLATWVILIVVAGWTLVRPTRRASPAAKR